MECMTGSHTHLGADGKTQLKCHDISTKHTNPTAQMYHQMMVQQMRGSDIPTNGNLESQSREEKARAQWDNIGRNFKKIYSKLNGRNKTRLMPLTAVLYASNFIYRNLKSMAPKDESQKIGYEKGFKKLFESLPEESQYKMYSEESFDKLTSIIDKRMEQLLNEPKSRKKGTAEYGELLCYWQYLSNLKTSVERAYQLDAMKGEDIKADPIYEKINRMQNLQRKRAQARTQSLRDVINQRKPPSVA